MMKIINPSNLIDTWTRLTVLQGSKYFGHSFILLGARSLTEEI